MKELIEMVGLPNSVLGALPGQIPADSASALQSPALFR